MSTATSRIAQSPAAHAGCRAVCMRMPAKEVETIVVGQISKNLTSLNQTFQEAGSVRVSSLLSSTSCQELQNMQKLAELFMLMILALHQSLAGLGHWITSF